MLIGILLTLAAAACFECSYVLQTLQVRAVPEMRHASVSALRRLAARPVWLASIAAGVAGFGLQVLALRHVPLSLAQPLLATGLVGLLAFSATVLGEPVGRREICAVAAIIVGVSLIALGDPQRSDAATPDASFVLTAVALGIVGLSAFAPRRAGSGGLLAAAIAADALAALAAVQAARAVPGIPSTAAWCALAGASGIAAVAAESAVLQRRGAARVAPVVLAGQTAVPVALAPLVIDERWGVPALVVCGLALVIFGSALLASSAGVGRLVLGEPEHEIGGSGQIGHPGT